MKQSHLGAYVRNAREQANLTRFIELVNERHGQSITTYRDLQAWSVNNLSDFWDLMWEFGGVEVVGAL